MSELFSKGQFVKQHQVLLSHFFVALSERSFIRCNKINNTKNKTDISHTISIILLSTKPKSHKTLANKGLVEVKPQPRRLIDYIICQKNLRQRTRWNMLAMNLESLQIHASLKNNLV